MCEHIDATNQKTAFLGEETERTKLVIDNKTLKQVSHFNCLGCDATNDYSEDCERKLN